MDASQGTTIRMYIFVALSETAIQAALPQNKHLGANRFKNAFCMLDQRPAIKFQKSFVGAHPGTSAARQHESAHSQMHDVYVISNPMILPAPSSSRLATVSKTESPFNPGTVTKTRCSITLAESVLARNERQSCVRQGTGSSKARSASSPVSVTERATSIGKDRSAPRSSAVGSRAGLNAT